MLTDLGFVDSLNQTGVNHHSGLIAMLSNPYAAMPSLHTAYAITIGATGFAMTRNRFRYAWIGYPALVVFSIVVTANHFFLDAIAGAGVAATAFLLGHLAADPPRRRSGRRRRPSRAWQASTPPASADRRGAASTAQQ